MEKPGMIPAMLARAAVLGLVGSAALLGSAAVGDTKNKYHFELTAVTPKPQVKADVAGTATPRIEGQVKKAFAEHPQLVGKLEGVPDPKNPYEYRAYLKQKGL